MNGENSYKAQYEDAYRQQSKDWDKDPIRKDRFRRITRLIAKFRNAPEMRILDFGAGDGYLSAFLEKQDHYAYADVASDAQTKRIRESRSETLPLRDDFSLPENAGTFDAIILAEVIEHLGNPLQTLLRLRDALRPDGILVVTTPNAFYWGSVARGWLGRQIDPSGQHVAQFDRSALANLLALAGFRQAHAETCYFSYVTGGSAPRLDRALSTAFPHICLDLISAFRKNR